MMAPLLLLCMHHVSTLLIKQLGFLLLLLLLFLGCVYGVNEG